MKLSFNARGQALILIALAAIGLFAFAALGIDGSRVYSDKRHAQNAADTAALAAALDYARNGAADSHLEAVAFDRASSNGYDHTNVTKTEVAISFAPYHGCPNGTSGREITVKIVSYLDMTLARVIGRNQFKNEATATSRACKVDPRDIVKGNAVIGCNSNNTPSSTNPCGIDTGQSNSKAWNITGGGVYSNGCFYHDKGTLNIPNDKCLSAGGTTYVTGGGTHSCVKSNQPTLDCDALMPSDPCTGAITSGRYAGGGKVATSGQLTFNNDVFCLADIDYFDGEVVRINNATLYVTDMNIDVQYPGNSGGFSGTATQAGTYPASDTYAGFAVIIAPNATPCIKYQSGPQTFTVRGNAGEDLTGIILAPTACLDLRGTPGGQLNGQVIGYTVTSNGDAEFRVNYNPNDNPFKPADGDITLLR